jgi:hypothetical protein
MVDVAGNDELIITPEPTLRGKPAGAGLASTGLSFSAEYGRKKARLHRGTGLFLSAGIAGFQLGS